MNKLAEIAVEKIVADKDFNSRKVRNAKKFQELIASIKEQGLINPITVSKNDDGTYSVRAGFRRWGAISAIREESPDFFETVPVNIVSGSAAKMMLINATENLERENLTPFEETMTIARLSNQGMKPQSIAEKFGRTEAWVSNHLSRANKLAPKVQEAYKEGTVKPTQASKFALLDEEAQTTLLPTILETAAKEGSAAASKQLRVEVEKARTNKRKRMMNRKAIETALEEVEELLRTFLICTDDDRVELGFLYGQKSALEAALQNNEELLSYSATVIDFDAFTDEEEKEGQEYLNDDLD